METQTYDTLPPIRYDTNIATIVKLGEQYMPLKITDLEDKEQFKAVHDARMVMVKVRTTIEKQRKEQKAKALQYGREVDEAAGKLYDYSTPIEEHLQTEEDKVLNEQKRIKEEKERIEREKIQKRVNALQQYGVVKPFDEVATCSDEEFASMLSYAKDTFEAEQKAKAEEEARLAEERAELARKAEEQAKRDREQAEKEAKLRAEREAFEREKREAQEAKERAEFEAKAKEEARIQAEQDAAAKVEREKREAEEAARKAKEKEEAEKAEATRQEALRPDKEKLIAWVRSFNNTNLPEPQLASEEAELIFRNALAAIEIILQRVEEQAEGM